MRHDDSQSLKTDKTPKGERGTLSCELPQRVAWVINLRKLSYGRK